MSDNHVQIGDNSNSDLRSRAEELAGVLDDIAELQDRAKKIKSDAKAEGYDMKAFNQVVKEKRRGAAAMADQLQLELVLDTYRKGIGLPVTLEEAQRIATEEAGELPEEKSEKKAKRDSSVVAFSKTKPN